jgi:hypothetical protein
LVSYDPVPEAAGSRLLNCHVYVILLEGDVSSELVFKLKKHKKETETEPSGPALLVNGVKASAQTLHEATAAERHQKSFNEQYAPGTAPRT